MHTNSHLLEQLPEASAGDLPGYAAAYAATDPSLLEGADVAEQFCQEVEEPPCLVDTHDPVPHFEVALAIALCRLNDTPIPSPMLHEMRRGEDHPTAQPVPFPPPSFPGVYGLCEPGRLSAKVKMSLVAKGP